ncbi:hypothetical protein LX16_2310 [Stackebrandtia albiflava]|uniref:PH (Pleckstrin Homology) domain-containing protein n=1 Tax=Stackebrandtia albiflava TaxID=406432 RepID=A0A562V160_9ACTN|nr:hypothetical protein [Stackebrandtia albiflava]TWJ11585.1 hypothetical protein LX16_2310 [Stackebrandtia albiflava]
MQRQAAEWVVVRRRAPRRAIVRLVTYLLTGVGITAVGWVLFVTEPQRLASGDPNPAARAPLFVAICVVFAVAAATVPVWRPPRLAVNHYGLAVRPGAFRTVLLPWVHVEEVAALTVPGRRRGEAYLLFACDGHLGRHSGDRPRFVDRAVLREADRATEGRATGFDLAVRLTDFRQSPEGLLRDLAGFAPPHVLVADRVE